MNHSDNDILKSLCGLIEYSTDFRFKNRSIFKQLHASLIKEFFKATSVVLDTDKQIVYLGIDMLEKGAEVCIEFDNLEKLLKSCIRPTQENLSIYKNILYQYKDTEAIA